MDRVARGGRLVAHVAHHLVLPQAQKRRMAQQTIAGPAGKADLGHQLRHEPSCVAGDGRRHAVDRVRLAGHVAESGHEIRHGGIVEAGADAARVAQPPVRAAHREQQRRERPARHFRRGQADDDELLPGRGLDLQPGAPAAGSVRGLRLLGDDALQAQARGFGEEGRPIADDMIAVEHRPLLATLAERFGEPTFALEQRLTAQVAAVQHQQVEGHQRQCPTRAVERLLQQAEIAPAVGVRHHDLAVEQGTLQTQRQARRDQLGKALAPVEPRPGVDARLPGTKRRARPDTRRA